MSRRQPQSISLVSTATTNPTLLGLVAASTRRRDGRPSSVERRLAVAGVGLVPSPVGLGRHGVAIETARDKQFLRCAHKPAFTEEVRGGAGYGAQVAEHVEHLCSVQPDEGG